MPHVWTHFSNFVVTLFVAEVTAFEFQWLLKMFVGWIRLRRIHH